MKNTTIIIVVLFFCTIKTSNSQSLTQLGFIPRINYTTPINKYFNFNGTFFSEVDVFDDQVGDLKLPKKVINLTFVAGVSYKLNSNNLLTGGYLFRIIDPFEDGESRIEHRLIQQFVHIQHFGIWRLRHHLRSEQRFIESSLSNGVFNTFFRFSYTFGWDVPLQGKQLDTNEFYLNSVTSYFIQANKPRNAFNNLNEFYIGLGYKTKNIGRFEIGPEAKLVVRNRAKDLNTTIFIDIIWYPEF